MNAIGGAKSPIKHIGPERHFFPVSYPLAQVAGEDEVPGEGVGEGRVELQHLEQGFPLDDVQVAVGQRPDVGGGVR